jgi:hypothetical protein
MSRLMASMASNFSARYFSDIVSKARLAMMVHRLAGPGPSRTLSQTVFVPGDRVLNIRDFHRSIHKH